MKRKSTTTPTRDEVAITAIIASASPENQPILKKFDATLKTLLSDARAQGHRPPETAEEFMFAIDSIEGFLLAQPASREVAIGAVELLEQLFTNSRKFPAAHLAQLGKALQAERKRIAALEKMLDEVSPEIGFAVFEEHANITKNEIKSVLAGLRADLGHFDGEVTDRAAFITWITAEAEAELAHRADICASERMRHEKFRELYKVGEHAVYDGVWEILKTCFDLGATKQEAEEVAHRTWAAASNCASISRRRSSAIVQLRVFADFLY